MFSNQLSAKELYSTNPSQFLVRSGFCSDQEDSAISSSQTMSQSNSQMMSSQMDNSQSSSFDLFSQVMSQQQSSLSQQTENSSNPQRFYMKYMSKPPLFNKEPDKNPLSSSRPRSFQDQLQINKQKAKERDDRDLINTFISLVKECTEEVKSAARGIRKDVDTNISESASQFGSLIQKINEDMKTFHQTLLGAIQVREGHQATLEGLRQDIAARDAKIEVLEIQLDVAKKQRDEQVSLLEAYAEQQKMNRDHMGKMQVEQQTFCKTQMEQLQQDQEQCLLRCQSEKEAAQAMQATVAASRRDVLGDGLMSGRRPPVRDVDNWQLQYDQARCPSWPANGVQENPAQPNVVNLMHPNATTSQRNKAVVGHLVNPAVASFSNHANIVSLPAPSAEWSVPLQNRESYLQPGIECNSGYSFVNRSSLTHQSRPTVPNANGFVQGPRPAGFNNQQGIHQAVPPVMSPPGASSTQSVQWGLNKVKPSPVAAVAPQVKATEVVQPIQANTNDGNGEEESTSSETPKSRQPKGKKRKIKYQVAVQTRKQSARLKAKQSLSGEGKINIMTNDKPQQGQRGRQSSQRVCNVNSTQADATQQAKSTAGHLQSQASDEEVYQYQEPEREKVITKKKVPEERNDQSKLKTSSSSNQESKHLQRFHGQEVNKTVRQVRVIHHQTKVVSEDVYRFTEPEEKDGLNRKVRRNQGDRHEWNPSSKDHLARQSQQDDIFSQKRVTTYRQHHQDGAGSSNKTSSRRPETLKKHKVQARRQRYPKTDIISDGSSSSEDDESGSQNSQVETDVADEVLEEQPMRPAKKKPVPRKTKQQSAEKKLSDKPASRRKQCQVSHLTTMSSYSSQDDSSDETVFSLKLPNSPCNWYPGLRHQLEHNPQQPGEQVVPIGTCDILSTPYIQVHQDEDSDKESTGTTYSVCVGSGNRMSRQMERKRRLSHYTVSSSAAAAMLEITNSLRLQHHKIRRVSSHR